MADVPIWTAGSLKQPGDLVRPTNSGVVSQPPLDNPSMDDGNSGWTDTGLGSFTIDTDPPIFDGTYSMKLGWTDNPNGQVLHVVNDELLPVTPGQIVTLRMYVQSEVTGDYARIMPMINWYSAALAPLAPTTLPLDPTNVGGEARINSSGLSSAAANLVWVLLEFSGVAPAGAAFWTAAMDAHWGDCHWTVDKVSYSYAFTEEPNTLIFRATQAAAGFTGNTEPDWPVSIGLTVVDNDVTWEGVSGNSVTWEASRILVSGAMEPVWPLAVTGAVADNTMQWTLDSRRVTDTHVPNDSEVVLIASSKVFAGDDDIVDYSATVNPLDWSTRDDAGYIPFGLQQYGANKIRGMGLYRGNLAIFNSQGCQLWQLDEDPAGITYLDAIPVSCTYPKSIQPVADDLAFLSNLGIRSLGMSGSAVNLQGGFFGQQVDPLVVPALKQLVLEDGTPIGLYWPARGQYWLFFGVQAFVLTITATPSEKKQRSWSRYIFPWVVTDWTIQGTDLVLRAGDLIEIVDPDATLDDSHDGPLGFIDLQRSTRYGTAGWGIGDTNVVVGGSFGYANQTPVYLIGAPLETDTLLFADTTVDGAIGDDTVTASHDVAGDAGNRLIVHMDAEGPYTVTAGNTVGSSEITLATGLTKYVQQYTALRITRGGGTDWNFLAAAVEIGDTVLTLIRPLEHVITNIRVHPVGTICENANDNMVGYLALEIANINDDEIELAEPLKVALDGAPAIIRPFQATTVAGGQTTTHVTLADAAEIDGGTSTIEFFTDPGIDVWEVPAGVDSIDILAVGGGPGGFDGGGAFFAANGGGGGGVDEQLGVAVTPGEVLDTKVGEGGPGGDFQPGGTDSFLKRGVDVLAQGFEGGQPGLNTPFAGDSGPPTSHGGGTQAGGGAGGGGAGGTGESAPLGDGGIGIDKSANWPGYGDDGFFGGGGAGADFMGAGHGVNGKGHGPNCGGAGFADFTGGQDGDDGILLIKYATLGPVPELGFPAAPVIVGPDVQALTGDEFTGVIQWPFIDMKNPGSDKELVAFDLVITGACSMTIGWDQTDLDYSVDGAWTELYAVDGDTLPGQPVPFSVTGPTLSLRLEFAPNQAWEWFMANLYVKDLNV